MTGLLLIARFHSNVYDRNCLRCIIGRLSLLALSIIIGTLVIGCQTAVDRAWRSQDRTSCTSASQIETWLIVRFDGAPPTVGLMVPIFAADEILSLRQIYSRSMYFRSLEHLSSLMSKHDIGESKIAKNWPCAIDEDVSACLSVATPILHSTGEFDERIHSSIRNNRAWNACPCCGGGWFVFPVSSEQKPVDWKYHWLWFRDSAELSEFARSGHEIVPISAPK